jgi:uncharacterized protein
MRGVPSCPIDYRGYGTTPLGRAWDRVLLLIARALCSGRMARMSYEMGLLGRIEVREHRFEIARRHGKPLTIAFASDLHAGATTDPRLIDDACRVMRALAPDLVLLGGDYVAFEAREVEPVLPYLAQLRAPLGVYGVLGNHDLCTDTSRVVAALESAGVTMLANRSVRLPAPHDDIWLCGLDDPTLGHPRADAAFAGTADRRIVLMHSPDGLLAIAGHPFDIAMCGHTHAGQVALPGGHALVVPRGVFSRRYLHGTYRVGPEQQLLVSAGVGCSTLPVRLFTTPEVHLCTVVRRAAEDAEAA